MPGVIAVEIALPERRYALEEVARAGAEWLRDDPDAAKLFDRFLRASETGDRYFSLPLETLLGLAGMSNRAAAFEELGPLLGEEALRRALERADRSPAEVEALLFTSCSSPSIPAIDGIILERVGLRRSVSRLPIYQHGCAGGVIGLEVACDFAASRQLVALTSVELCSLVFQPRNHRPAQIVGSAIFADGAAAALVSAEERGLVFVDRGSFLLPNSRHLMGYDIFDDGVHLRLDRDLPHALAEAAPLHVGQFLKQNGLTEDAIDYWLFHPGGVRILEFLEQSFSLKPDQCRWSREVLRSVGNLSSATILFVLKSFLDSKVMSRGDYALMMGIGPGLTIELILFRWNGDQ